MALQTLLSTATEGTDLTTLGAGARAISNATGDLNNITAADHFLDLELVVNAGTVAAGAIVAEVYMLPSVDGTNFADGSTSLTPASANLVARFEARSTSGVQRMVVERIPIPPLKLRWLLLNPLAGAYTSATQTLKALTYKIAAA